MDKITRFAFAFALFLMALVFPVVFLLIMELLGVLLDGKEES